MNATSSPPVSADAEALARADLLACKSFATAWDGPMLSDQHYTVCGCCGTAIINKDGKLASGAQVDRPSGERVPEADRKTFPYWYDPKSKEEVAAVLELWYPSGGSGPGAEARRQSMWAAYSPAWIKHNKTGLFFGVGITKDKAIAAMFTPDHELYGKVEGLEFNDKDCGVVSLIWTNA